MATESAQGAGGEGGEKLSALTGAALFVTLGLGGLLSGFSITVASARRKSPKCFDQTLPPGLETGSRLALRALGWGSAFAVGGTALLSLGVWGALSLWRQASVTPSPLADEVTTRPMTSQR
ncbi:transmembrane protein 242 [Petromyzon marinus]|uniref:Transmembrane protein 242 n=1 Tax=Petromyzon marinus TaxID=7757 RepID=A0AAJ7UHK1_PETMA|nr:transmembrane protein 242 [Petromyzon marinus]